MKRVFVAVLFLLPSLASADPDRVSLLLGSRHVGAAGFEEVNPGVFLTWERPAVHWSLGVYRNSYGRVSVAGTGYVPLARWRGGDAGLFAGLAHYPQDGRTMRLHAGDVVPLAGIQIRHRHVFLQVMPMDGRPVDAVVSFGLTWATR